MEENKKYEQINRQIIDMKAALSSSESSIGDWKIMKCVEAQAQGKELPYDLDDLIAKRAEVRKKINELEAQLGA